MNRAERRKARDRQQILTSTSRVNYHRSQVTVLTRKLRAMNADQRRTAIAKAVAAEERTQRRASR
jgi:hypothetical protein